MCCGGYTPRAAPEDGHATLWLGPGEAAWSRRADMPSARAFHSSTAYAGRLWAIGDGLASYDPLADVWQEWLPAGTLPRSHFGAARVGHEVFVLGGEAQRRGKLSRIDLREPRLDEVDAPPGCAPGDHFPILVSLADRLHVLGGVDADVNPIRRHFVRDDAGWRALAEPPPGLWGKFSCHAVRGQTLWLFGDFGAFRYDTPSEQWTPLEPMPRTLVLPQAVFVGDRIHVLGGLQPGATRAAVHLVFDVTTTTWSDLTRDEDQRTADGPPR